MAAAGGLTFPLLEGVAPSYTHQVGAPLAAALAVRLIEVGLADPADWARAERSPMGFLEVTLQEWQRAAGGETVGEDYIGVGAAITSDIRTFFWEAAEDHSLERMWIVFEQAGFHDIIEMSHVATLLERVHPRLPATFYDCVRSINRVGYVWDAFETREWYEVHGDWIVERMAESVADANQAGEEYDEAEQDWPIEVVDNGGKWPTFVVKEMRLPAFCRKPLAESTVRRMIPKLTPRPRKILELALDLRAAAAVVDVRDRNHYQLFDELELHDTSHRTPPVLVLPMERYDAIERAWDEENHAMMHMGEPVQPLLAYHFDATDDEDLHFAHDTFAAVTRVYSLAAELLPLLPTGDPSTLAESLVEVEIS